MLLIKVQLKSMVYHESYYDTVWRNTLGLFNYHKMNGRFEYYKIIYIAHN